MEKPKTLDAYLEELDKIFFSDWDDKMLAEAVARARFVDTKIRGLRLKIETARQTHKMPSDKTVELINP
jgi:hypothetical protein